LVQSVRAGLEPLRSAWLDEVGKGGGVASQRPALLEQIASEYNRLIRFVEDFNLSCDELKEAADNKSWFDTSSWFRSSNQREAEVAFVVQRRMKTLKRLAAELLPDDVDARLAPLVEARIAELRACIDARTIARRETWRILVVAQATRRQHPVGQGGFHSAEVAVGKSRFRYVYDCGSESKGTMAREIKRLSEGRSSPPAALDLLVLSHLHADHVNGVGRLLKSHEVDRVLVPYLVHEERLVLLASACAEGRWSQSYHALVQDPVGWFRAESVDDVIFVLPSVEVRSTEDATEDPTEDAMRRPMIRDPDGTGEPGELRPLSGMVAPDDAMKGRYPGVVGASVVPPGGVLILSSGPWAVWALVPFTHPEPKLLAEFVAAAERALRMPDLRAELTSEEGARKLRDALADRAKRSALARAFKAVRPDQNLSSMSLYAGPAVAYDARCSARFVVHGAGPECGADSGRLGWLATGDAPLASAARADRFEKFYGAFLPQVGTFVVPHHGSRKNFTGEVFKETLKPADWVVPVGVRNRHKHPDRALMNALRARGAERRVTQRPGTEFVEVLSVVWDRTPVSVTRKS
jgi:hypothetical protein